MGLFDTVRCEYPLPEPAHQHVTFQTKDLECLLVRYTITADGRLVRHASRSPLSHRLVRDVEWPIEGELRIFESLARPGPGRDWVEYRVRFTDGYVERIEPVPGPRDTVAASVVPFQGPRLPVARAAGLPQPAISGRRLTAHEFTRHVPRRVELVEGGIPGAEPLLMLLLTQVGLKEAALLVGEEAWRAACPASDTDGRR